MILNSFRISTCFILPLSFILPISVMAQEGAKCSCKDPIVLAILVEDQAVKVHLDISVGGQSLSSVWEDSFRSLHKYFDRNHDGSIDSSEVKLLPSPIAFRHAMGSGFLPPVGVAPSLAEMDIDKNEKIEIYELKSYYHHAGVDRTRIGIGHLPWSQELRQSILKHIGNSAPLQVGKAKWRVAWSELLKLDANDDELIGAGELVAGAVYPGVSGATLLQPIQEISNAPSERLVLVDIDPQISIADWSKIISKQFPSHSIDWQSWVNRRPDACWQIDLKSDEYNASESESERPVTHEIKEAEVQSFAYSSDQIFFEGWQADGRVFEALRSARETIEKQLQSPQADNDSSDRRRGGSLDWLLPIADCNCNGEVDADEFDGWFAVQKQFARGQVLIQLLDKGDLFESLDANHDGALSNREIRNAPQIFQQMPKETTNGVRSSIQNFPPAFRAIVSRGYSQSIRRHLESGPSWFHAMDRNGDGDVSQREFTGPLEAFRKLDKDQDTVIDPYEARTANDTPKT